MNWFFYFAALSGAFLFNACHSACGCDVDPDRVCYAFDIRQCDTDVFSEDVSIAGSREAREDDLASWLEAQGIDVISVDLVIGFHQVVCEACDVCPQGDRYFIEIMDEFTTDELESFRFLNLDKRRCDN